MILSIISRVFRSRGRGGDPQDQKEGFHCYRYTDLTDEAVFEEYVSQVQAAALYDTGVQAEYGDTLLTLSACSCRKDNGRIVVAARCKKKKRMIK